MGPTKQKLCWLFFCLCCFARDNTTKKESEKRVQFLVVSQVTKKKGKKKKKVFFCLFGFVEARKAKKRNKSLIFYK